MSKKQDTYYFNNFIKCAEYSCQAAELLKEIASNFKVEDVESYISKMHVIEHAADIKKHELTSTLVKSFITPIDREDIVHVSQNIDELTDKLEDVMIRIYYNHVDKIRPDVLPLIDTACKACNEVLNMLKEFADFKHSKKLKEHLIHINSLEEESDKLFISAMYNLHDKSNNVMDIIAWRDIYTYLEKCSDTAEHIADIVESVVMKNT